MVKFELLAFPDQCRVFKAAAEWSEDHLEHVQRLAGDGSITAIEPSGSDMFHPELWKGIHWRWYINRLNGRTWGEK